MPKSKETEPTDLQAKVKEPKAKNNKKPK